MDTYVFPDTGGEAAQVLARKLELLASVHFLIDREQVSGIDTGRIAATLKQFNKDFNEQDVKQALDELKIYGLLAA